MSIEEKVIDESIQGQATMVENKSGSGKKLYLESYGCQMNFSDSEIIASILSENGYATTRNVDEADVILMNTCSIRENAEQRVRNKLSQHNKRKKQNPGLVIGILGCMAERLKKDLLEQEKLVDLVAGPDAYRDLPNLISDVGGGQKAVNVLLSREETYADISPVRLDKGGVTAFISIMRGCDNMCSFCVVPFTRGRERSRDPESIVQEAKDLFERGYREVTLLGQNVDSYRWNITKKGEIIDPEKEVVNFAMLLEKVALVNPLLRVRFSTSHPKDMTDDVLITMAKHRNICDYIHLPVQSGNNEVLKRMNRGYSVEWYKDRLDAIRRIIPEAFISTDIITGFCGETEEQHQDTMELMKYAKYEFAYMFFYSERPKTLAERKFEDDIPEDIKKRRLNEVQELQVELSFDAHKRTIGKVCEVLIEGLSKRSEDFLVGRNSQNLTVILPRENHKPGDYVNVLIEDCTSATATGVVVND
ncbi:tRNA (N6-isopentenyl adenosine(37)-C2)-methylthiotransferase MiaB [Paracrocinitomix mangrovi]|uniref:tRNA (N6-isopentenyl adenosine(37)-C2)-methylthiotransferase MiaB n=1 Tax=Paracrocinitomix mangrovi TaxID=2862509 RepID=UPI001C8EAB6B|nr:tRNA (N6-isopentenyl adenosine(37)-C2)-methylthiotransferase MiaB [Paracrocinitomix mangrovi]UKN03291.1 tRNA (N6-isopentenyl adenosine(37)-C2)-methylthiotransferase MiaB [Paracrocinitomix mangrovi]